MEALQQPWQVQEKAMETDINSLKWVEDLEQRVIAADLHLKVKKHLTSYESLLCIHLIYLIVKQQLQLKLREIKI